MKKEGHPAYYPNAKVTCACGNTFATGSTVEELHVEICSACHPFYTGKQKLADERGRVDRFQKLMQKKSTARKPTKKVDKAEATPAKKVTTSR